MVTFSYETKVVISRYTNCLLNHDAGLIEFD